MSDPTDFRLDIWEARLLPTLLAFEDPITRFFTEVSTAERDFEPSSVVVAVIPPTKPLLEPRRAETESPRTSPTLRSFKAVRAIVELIPRIREVAAEIPAGVRSFPKV
jgi:hypothetical protein